MDIGRTPNIAPGTLTSINTGNKVQAVQTILPAYQTVTRADRPESAQLTFREFSVRTAQTPPAVEQEQAPQPPEQEIRNREVRREIELDRDTTALVFRSIDVTTGDVVRQYPEEARLKLSAYLSTIVER